MAISGAVWGGHQGTENCAEVNELLDEHIGHVATRIRELKVLERQLKSLRVQCASNHLAADCGILSGLETAARSSRGSKPSGWVTHVHGSHHSLTDSPFKPARISDP